MIDLDDKIETLKRIIKEEWEKSNTPGLAVGILSNGELVDSLCFGYANLEAQDKVDEDTVFMWGSITKPFTTVSLMQQYEKGKFKLDDPVNKYLPNDHGKIQVKKGWPEVTFRHLLTHNSGIGELRRFKDIFKHGFRLLSYDNEPVPPLSSLHRLALPTTAPAGQKYAYSNIGYSLLGYIVELLSGERFRDYIVNHIFDPLGMKNSDMIRSKRVKGKEAKGYKYKKGEHEKAKRWNNIIKPSGALLSNINDMVKFAKMLNNRGSLNDVQILKEETVELMWKPHYASHEAFKDHYYMGFDFFIYNMNGHRVIEHTGGIGGFTAVFTLLPDEDIAFTICANLHEALSKRVTRKIRNRFLKVLTEIPKDPDKVIDEDLIPKKEYWPMITGYYGGYPGWLSNTRIYLEGGDFKVSEKRGKLYLSSLYGDLRKKKRLYPTTHPLVYQFKQESDSGDIFPTTRVGFTINEEKDDVKEIGIHFLKMRKMSFYATMRFKLYFWIVLVIIIVLLGILL